MNIFKSKKIIATALTFVMVMALVGLPLAAKERRGYTVVVTMIDGSLIKGELLGVKADALLLYDQDARQGKSISLEQVAQVKVLKKTKFGDGLLIGYGVGLVIMLGNIDKNSLMEKSLIFTLPIIPGLLGGLIGAIASGPEKFYLAEVSSKIMQQNLEKLKRYAREQD